MPSSGTFLFNPAASDLVLNAFSRCGKSGVQLTAEHLRQAYIESNLLNVEWANRGVNLWKSETIQFPAASTLTQGVGAYPLPASTIAVQLAYIQTGSATAPNERVLGPMTGTQFSALPAPLDQGPPTSFFFDRQIIPTMNLWPVPDQSNFYTGFVRALIQIQDVVLPAGVTLDTPYRFLDAFTSGLAKRLSVHYAIERFQMLDVAAEKAWSIATTQDADGVPLSITPMLGQYYRI